MKYRTVCLSGLIIGIASVALVNAHDLHMDSRASGECQAMEKESNDKAGESAWDRSQDPNASQSDVDRGMDWARDNLS